MKTSIIVLTHNKLDYTKKCIESIRANTQIGTYEIIVVDNHSIDGTVNWLQRQNDIRSIYNKENLGFPKGCNQGIEIASGDNILLLNNDTIVTHHWLDNLIASLYSSESVGAVGPVTNNCSYYQSINVNYKDEQEMHSFAKKFNKSNPELWEQRLKLVGFCMLIKRAAIKEVGVLDEIFSPGNYEDDDFSIRLRIAGYKLLLCKDTFIHHFGSVSFKDDNGKYSELLKINREKFFQKWGFDSAYSTIIRFDIINLIDAKKDKDFKVLEVGCACGGTLLEIKNKYKNATTFGIELNQNAAKVASSCAQVISANIEEVELEFPEGYFDYIIFADVLEHLQNPWKALQTIRKHLKLGGKILASIPNVMHYSVIRNLLAGSWTYEDAGILDKTHLRFFTLKEIDKMFSGAGYINLEYSMTTISETEQDKKYIQTLCQLGGNDVEQQYSAYQYLIKANTANAVKSINEIVNNINNQLDISQNIHQLAMYNINEVIDVTLSFEFSIELLNFIATQFYVEKYLDNVLPCLQKALELDENNPNTLFNLGYILHQCQESSIALQYLEKIGEKDKDVVALIEEIQNSKPKSIEAAASKITEEIQPEQEHHHSFVDPSCDIRGIEKIKMGSNVVIQRDCWVNIAFHNPTQKFMIEFGEGTNIGRRCTISAANKIVFGKNVLLGPNILVTDHNHEYAHIGLPVMNQGITSATNQVFIGDGTWVGTNSVIVGNVKIGKGCVIGSNSVINKDIPDYCVAVGNPCKVIKIFDTDAGRWIKVNNEEHLKMVVANRQELLNYIVPFTNLRSLQVEVSSACNLKCPQCFNRIEGHNTDMLDKQLWDTRIKPVLRQLKDIHLVGIGEPLLNKNFFCFVEDAVNHGVIVHTTSNLQLVDKVVAEKIVLSGLNELSFSCDGATKETYEKIRISGTFEKLKNSLKLINEYKAKYNSELPRLILNFGGMKSNIHELPEIIKLAKEFNVEQVIAYHNVIYVEELKEESLYHEQQLSDTNFLVAKQIAKDLGINLFFPGLFSEPVKSCHGAIYCSYPYAHLWVYSDGRIGPCCMDFPVRYNLGDLKISSMEEVWNSNSILKLRQELHQNPSYTCRFCVMHGKMDITDPRYFFRFNGSDCYISSVKTKTEQ